MYIRRRNKTRVFASNVSTSHEMCVSVPPRISEILRFFISPAHVREHLISFISTWSGYCYFRDLNVMHTMHAKKRTHSISNRAARHSRLHFSLGAEMNNLLIFDILFIIELHSNGVHTRCARPAIPGHCIQLHSDASPI